MFYYNIPFGEIFSNLRKMVIEWNNLLDCKDIFLIFNLDSGKNYITTTVTLILTVTKINIEIGSTFVQIANATLCLLIISNQILLVDIYARREKYNRITDAK